MAIKGGRFVEIELVGGLGNQLFGYFAGAYYSEKFKKNLITDFTQVPLGMTNHGSELTSFKLNKIEKIIKSNRYPIHNFLKRLIDKLSIKFKLFNYLRFKIFGTYQSIETGYDNFIETHNKISRMQGYYQTWKYFDYLEKHNFDVSLELINPSKWFTRIHREINPKNSIAIHVRRGDYKNPNSPTGLLSRDYYEVAIATVNGKFSNHEFWVFSDDISDAKILLSGLIPEGSKWIIPPDRADPAESLVLMSYMKAIIVANSSFSWWAATANVKKELVIAPDPWFKNTKTPLNLIPNSWELIRSRWI
jgi:hypothetical protein